ncbi:benzoate/H(+) symporter BenE family transporter [Pseudoalteromonas denitrificans]|uniref:Benzoate membrane transport protein n=1 Tax=Pseudoalteromonas denitrificans DSM 6059 TaxID=1123010 RepID=A0A1I1NIL0_9GAMM|nr:benzoate/H(+) symporter BenE family transporter [Pseudoalteromonas denitrificans]SFC97544.1 benzoate membrane transport protein [Pseudoalteromonas denitrificans DSM 6059]
MTKTQNILSRITAGFVAILVGFTSSVALIYQMVINLGGDAALVSSWLLILGLSLGVLSIALSLFYKIPILIAWSTPGAALLITSSQGFSLEQATGAFIVSAALIFVCGITGIFEKLMHHIPYQLANAMLAGVLVNFGIDVFNLMSQQTFIIIMMITTYIIAKVLTPRFTMLIVLIVGVYFSWQYQLINLNNFEWQFSTFHYIQPEFDIAASMSIALPLFIVTMASQNLPGIAVLQAHEYPPPISSTLNITGFTNMLIAPFGGYAINLAAISAAICMNKDVDNDKSKRYWATVCAGVFYILMGLASASLIDLFKALPNALIMSLAGIALFSTIATSLKKSLEKPALSEAAIITFLVTASDLVLWQIGSALWGIIAGCITLLIQNLLIKREIKTKVKKTQINKLS